MNSSCPFCTVAAQHPLDRNEFGFAIRDGFPVSPGHTLIIPHRHISSFFELEPAERDGLMALLEQAKCQIDSEFNPTTYNIGINDGVAAGQSVPHLHIHLIPRYEGDMADPRGGVRFVIPEKAKYWKD